MGGRHRLHHPGPLRARHTRHLQHRIDMRPALIQQPVPHQRSPARGHLGHDPVRGGLRQLIAPAGQRRRQQRHIGAQPAVPVRAHRGLTDFLSPHPDRAGRPMPVSAAPWHAARPPARRRPRHGQGGAAPAHHHRGPRRRADPRPGTHRCRLPRSGRPMTPRPRCLPDTRPVMPAALTGRREGPPAALTFTQRLSRWPSTPG